MKKILLAGLTMATLATFTGTSQAALIGITNYPFTTGNISYSAFQNAGFFLQSGDFLALYDAGESPFNITGDLANSSLFAISMNLVDVPAPSTIATDDPTITNLRFTYIGATDLTDISLGTFSLADPSNQFRFVEEQTSSHNSSGQQGESGTSVAPVLASPVPEPSSLALIITAMLGFAGAAKRKLLSRG